MPEAMNKEQLTARLGEIGPLIEPIQGWLDPEAGAMLYQLARLHAPSPIVVELGSWRGLSTAWLGCGIRDRGEGRVYAIDTWLGTATETLHADLLKGYGPDQLYDEFRANMHALGVAGVVEPWRMTTIEAARRWDSDAGIGLLHIDASHEYADVRADFERWAPFVAPGGYIAFDDVPSFPGPARLITELPRWYAYAAAAPNQWYVRKTPP